MKIEKISGKDNNTVELRFDRDMTILIPLRDELLKSSNTDIVTLNEGHPLVDKPLLFIRVKRGNPINEVKKAIKNMISKIESFEKELEKSIN